MSACVSVDMGAKDPNAIASHIWNNKIASWADYENGVAEGIIKDMDDPISPSGSSNTSSSPKGEDDRSRASSLSTWPELTAIQTDVERLTSMLTASAAHNRDAEVLAASRLPRSGLNPFAPAFAMRTSPVNREVQAMKQQINTGYKRYAQERKECQENGDIQAFIDLIVAGPASRSDNSIQRSIDNIVAAAALKKKREHKYMILLAQGLRENAIAKPEQDHTVWANDPAIIVAR